VEAHPPLAEDQVDPPTLTDLSRLVVEATRQVLVPVDWAAVQRAYAESRGIPLPVTAAAPPTTLARD